MKITIYELLEMIKEGKPPKTIKSEGHYYNYNELEEDYYEGMGYEYEYLLANTSVKGLDAEIEIIEYTPKEEIKRIIEDMDLVANYNKVPISYTQKQIKTLLDYITNLQQRIDKATNYYLKTLSKNGSMPSEAVDMFNILEGNK